MTVTKDLIIPEDWAKKFDLVVQECSGALSTGVNTIKDSLVVMNGIRSLKNFFQTPEVKELIEMSKESPAGFLTDRNDQAIFKHNKNPNKKYELKPYTYKQIVEALIPCALEGYRLHGNEINIISGKGMPVKAGKHRRIIEMTDGYQDNISTPAIKDGFAFMKCKAKWIIDGQAQTIGYDEGDDCHIKVSFGKWDSIDKVLGLAESKLYTRVLRRITGKYIVDEPVSTDVTEGSYEVKGNEVLDTKNEIDIPDLPAAADKKTTPPENQVKEQDLHENVAHLKKTWEDKAAYGVIFEELFREGKTSAQEINYAIAHNLANEALNITELVDSRVG